MGSKPRLGSYCTKRANNGVNLVTSRNINTRLARPIYTFIISKIYLKFKASKRGFKKEQFESKFIVASFALKKEEELIF